MMTDQPPATVFALGYEGSCPQANSSDLLQIVSGNSSPCSDCRARLDIHPRKRTDPGAATIPTNITSHRANQFLTKSGQTEVGTNSWSQRENAWKATELRLEARPGENPKSGDPFIYGRVEQDFVGEGGLGRFVRTIINKLRKSRRGKLSLFHSTAFFAVFLTERIASTIGRID